MTGKGALFLLCVTYWSTSQAERAPLFGSQNSVDTIRDEYVVLFKTKPSTNCTEVVKTMSALWAMQNKEMRVLREFHIGELEAVHIKADPETLESLRDMPDVRLIEANQQVRAAQGNLTITEDPTDVECILQETKSELWTLSRINSREKPSYRSAGYEYSYVEDGSGVDVYIADSGVYLTHDDFEGRAVHGMTASGLVSEGNNDYNGHGTHVAGIAAGSKYGVAKGARIISVKVLGADGQGNVAGVIEGIQWVVKQEGAKEPQARRAVLNLSLGLTGVSYALDIAIQEAVAAGISVVVAAGNDGLDACSFSPARVSTAITVGATDSDDIITSFSNHGPCVNILAPGYQVLSAYKGSRTSNLKLSGTSQAAPHVAGVVARHLSSLTDGTVLSPAQVKAYLSDTATKDKVLLESYRSATPNLLLYRRCSSKSVEGKDPEQNASSRSFTEISLALLLLSFILVVC